MSEVPKSKEVNKTMMKKIEDVRNAMNNGTYYCALALALTFPDICGQVESGVQESNRLIYIKWVNNHIEEGDFHFPIKGFEEQTFTGEMCYSLRCKILHNGNTDVKNQKLNVNVDEFKLTFPSESNYTNGYRYETSAYGKLTTYIGIDYLCERLCDAAEKFYNEWENKDDFLKFVF